MDLNIKSKFFLVAGATDGLGGGVCNALLNEGGNVIAVARNEDKLFKLQNSWPEQIEYIAGDITQSSVIDSVAGLCANKGISGALINAGGPPAKGFSETVLADWDQAYHAILRWKVEISQKLIPIFESKNYGRLLYIESESVKQPVRNLVLSNSLRLAVVGFVKTLSHEIAHKGITANILAPGFHETAAVKRLFEKRSQLEGISLVEARQKYVDQIPIGRMGDPAEFGKLGAWLLSPLSGFITGQTISMDGGSVKGTMG